MNLKSAFVVVLASVALVPMWAQAQYPRPQGPPNAPRRVFGPQWPGPHISVHEVIHTRGHRRGISVSPFLRVNSSGFIR
jgi:hypothetical protein